MVVVYSAKKAQRKIKLNLPSWVSAWFLRGGSHEENLARIYGQSLARLSSPKGFDLSSGS